MREPESDLWDVRDASIAAHANCLLPADIDSLDIGPRSVGAEDRKSRHAAVALVGRAREVRLRIHLAAIARPLGSLRAATLGVCDGMVGTIGHDGLFESRPGSPRAWSSSRRCPTARRRSVGETGSWTAAASGVMGSAAIELSRAFSITSSQQPSHAFHFGSVGCCCALETSGNKSKAEASASVFIRLLLKVILLLSSEDEVDARADVKT